MNYLTAMGRLLLFDRSALEQINGKAAPCYCMINVIVAGLVYGLCAAYFSEMVLSQKGLETGRIILPKIIIAGIPVAFLIHGGAALFVWVFLKALGGKAPFLSAYLAMGTASISLWPLLPFLMAFRIGSHAPVTAAFSLGFGLYAAAVYLFITRHTFRLSHVRMALATTVTVVYIGCFMYLWV